MFFEAYFYATDQYILVTISEAVPRLIPPAVASDNTDGTNYIIL